MGHKKHKIEIPTPQEVEQYAAGGPGEPPAGPAGAEVTPPPPAPEETPAGREPALAAEAQSWKDKYLRAKADLANYQRRVEKERSESLRYANAALVRSLLPVLDDLERVIASGRQNPDNAAGLLEGVTLTLENFLKVLREENVERIEAEGAPFDPQVHEAMMEQPSPDHAERTVLKEILKGYRLHDRVLRPVRVIVSRPVGPAAPAEPTPAEPGDSRPGADPGDAPDPQE